MERRTLDSCGKERENGDPAAQREAQVPPRGKRVTVAQWNERVETNQRDGNSECSSFRSNHFVMSQTLLIFLYSANCFTISFSIFLGSTVGA
ncbi:hypothetical protein [Priestia flexa]|uniref:hypothetical protein n=1 Tax=Priestia flexa TaxID=86664 RepID=UPI001268E3BF|nr:hypothetical protein [Priestia flexa]